MACSAPPAPKPRPAVMYAKKAVELCSTKSGSLRLTMFSPCWEISCAAFKRTVMGLLGPSGVFESLLFPKKWRFRLQFHTRVKVAAKPWSLEFQPSQNACPIRKTSEKTSCAHVMIQPDVSMLVIWRPQRINTWSWLTDIKTSTNDWKALPSSKTSWTYLICKMQNAVAAGSLLTFLRRRCLDVFWVCWLIKSY